MSETTTQTQAQPLSTMQLISKTKVQAGYRSVSSVSEFRELWTELGNPPLKVSDIQYGDVYFEALSDDGFRVRVGIGKHYFNIITTETLVKSSQPDLSVLHSQLEVQA